MLINKDDIYKCFKSHCNIHYFLKGFFCEQFGLSRFSEKLILVLCLCHRYSRMSDIADHFFPPISLANRGMSNEYSNVTYWRQPVSSVDQLDIELLKKEDATQAAGKKSTVAGTTAISAAVTAPPATALSVVTTAPPSEDPKKTNRWLVQQEPNLHSHKSTAAATVYSLFFERHRPFDGKGNHGIGVNNTNTNNSACHGLTDSLEEISQPVCRMRSDSMDIPLSSTSSSSLGSPSFSSTPSTLSLPNFGFWFFEIDWAALHAK